MIELSCGFDSLLNIGIIVDKIESKTQPQKLKHESVVILDTARSGTLMISGGLHICRIYG